MALKTEASGASTQAPSERASGTAPGRGSLTQRISRQAAGGGGGGGSADSGGEVSTATAGLLESAATSSGAPLRGDVRDRFEGSLGADLSAVRVHTGPASAQAAGAVGANAYATGNDIHFGAGQYQPDDPFGLHLLAHEVAHTQQQAGGVPHRQHQLEVSQPGRRSRASPAERRPTSRSRR
jgi:hypothetical protein